MQKVFRVIQSLLDFLKIICVFCMLMLMLYWIQHLAQLDWAWLGFIAPLLNGFIAAGEMVSDSSINFFGAIFEYKYIWALAFMGILYFILNLLKIGTEVMEEAYDNARRAVNKMKENSFNNQLKKEQNNEQLAIKKYQIFVSTSIKKKFCHTELSINIEEQNKIMNKFLIEKLGISPTVYRDGYLYSFNDFNKIDDVLDIFFKLISSKSPLNYFINVQILTNKIDNKELDSLIDLKFENKISMLSDTAFRYKFNASHRYGVSQLGIYQKENLTIEAHEFIVI